MIQNFFEKWFDSFGLRKASKVKNRVDISCDVIMVMNKVFLLFVSSMPVLSILFSFPLGKEAEDFGFGAWISWGKTKPLFLFFLPLFLFLLLFSKFEMYYGLSRVLLWGLTPFGLWFIDPISGRFLCESVFIRKKIKTRTNAKGKK